jgi:hypothetical protein
MNINDIITESLQKCPHCGGLLVEYSELGEGKKDACYYKVKASAKVWPSAYASGRLVQCRKKGAANYGNKSESVAEGLGDAASATPAKNERGRYTAWDDDEPMRLKCKDGEFRTIQEINMLRQKIGMKPFSIKSQQGVAEGKEKNHWYDAGVKDAENGKRPNPRTYLPTLKDKQAKHPEEVDFYMNGYKSVKPGVAENFADGRNPQDKGDAKRHGINTKASVSSLRKTAKQGGRKGQLAHWLANMKSGRAKNEDIAEAAHTTNFNDDDWYEINPDTKTIVSQRGPQAYRMPFGQRQIDLPNGNIVVRGMRAKGMGLDTGLDKPQQKEDGTWGAL